MYIRRAFERKWDNRILEMIQTATVENMVEPYKLSATLNIPGSPGADLGLKKDGEPGDNGKFSRYRALVGNLMWMPVIIINGSDITNVLCACERHSHDPSPRRFKVLLQAAAFVNATKEIGLRVRS